MTDEAITLLHSKKTLKILLSQRQLTKSAKDESMEAGIPKPLKRIFLRRGHHVTIMSLEIGGHSCPDIIKHQRSHSLSYFIITNHSNLIPKKLPLRMNFFR